MSFFPGFAGKKMKREGKLPNWTSTLSRDAVPLPMTSEGKPETVKKYVRVVPAALE